MTSTRRPAALTLADREARIALAGEHNNVRMTRSDLISHLVDDHGCGVVLGSSDQALTAAHLAAHGLSLSAAEAAALAATVAR
jgi:hypothetical protein